VEASEAIQELQTQVTNVSAELEKQRLDLNKQIDLIDKCQIKQRVIRKMKNVIHDSTPLIQSTLDIVKKRLI